MRGSRHRVRIKASIEVYVHHFLPQADIVVFDGTSVAENAGIVKQSVELAIAGFELGGQFLVGLTLGALKVQCLYGGLGAQRTQFKIQRIQRIGVSAVQNDRGSVACEIAGPPPGRSLDWLL